MAVEIIKQKNDFQIGTTGGSGGVYELDKYLRINFGPPSFVPWKLPANALVKWIVVKSSSNQTVKISTDGFDGDVLPETELQANERYVYPANFATNDAEVTITADCDPAEDFWVLIIYVDLNI